MSRLCQSISGLFRFVSVVNGAVLPTPRFAPLSACLLIRADLIPAMSGVLRLLDGFSLRMLFPRPEVSAHKREACLEAGRWSHRRRLYPAQAHNFMRRQDDLVVVTTPFLFRDCWREWTSSRVMLPRPSRSALNN